MKLYRIEVRIIPEFREAPDEAYPDGSCAYVPVERDKLQLMSSEDVIRMFVTPAAHQALNILRSGDRTPVPPALAKDATP